ncbi:MAG: PQQ-binding-like beta-propeller repeat protein [Planctomycetota bacterium]
MTSASLSFAATAASLLLATSSADARSSGSDWPRYRGPNGNGTVEDEAWASEGAEEPLWAQSVGRGYSSPSIAAGRLVTLGHFPEAGVDRVTCLDARTGEERWRHEFEAVDRPMFHGGGTLTTPTIVGDTVYCINRRGTMLALGLQDGALLWRRDHAERFHGSQAIHGISASPLPTADGTRLVQQFCGALAVLDAATGDVVWQTEDFGPVSQSNPVLLDLAEGSRRGVAAVLGQTFAVFDLGDGTLLHRAPWVLRGNAMHCAAPVVLDGGKVFVSTAYGKGGALFQLAEEEEPETLWSHRKMRNKVAATVPFEGHLYGFDESMLRCATVTGGTTWRKRGLGLGAVTRAGDRLLVVDSEGHLIVARARPDAYEELSRRKVLDGGDYWTAPVLVDGRVYVRNSLGDLVCLDHTRDAENGRVTNELEAMGGAGEGPAEASSEPLTRPEAQQLFDAHRAAVGAGSLAGQPDAALRLRGTWEIVLRGLEPAPMALTLLPRSKFLLTLEEGGLLYAHDGARSWAIEPQGARAVEGEEEFDLASLFDVEATFAPSTPKGAAVLPDLVRFADRDCWCVTSPSKREGDPTVVRHYFSSRDGRLVGREGSGMSTLAFEGDLQVGDALLPATFTRYRADDGQEHVLRFEEGAWVEPDASLFDPPRAIRRLLRTKAERLEDEADMRERFGPSLGAYRNDEVRLLPGFSIEVSDGELRLRDLDGNDFVIDAEDDEGGFLQILGLPPRIRLTAEEDGTRVALLPVPGPQGVRPVRFPRVE